MSLNWAIGENDYKAQQPELLDASEREIVWFDILKLFDYTCPPWTLDPDNLRPRDGRKVDAAREHFENEGWMDPSDVRRMHSDGIHIRVEGRHRLIAAIQLGETYAPFSVPIGLVDKLKSTIATKRD